MSYAEERDIPTLWYRIDEADCEPANLFYYMRLALQAFERNVRASVELPSSARSDVIQFARRFFEALFARFPKAMLVLDDYHLAREDTSWQVTIEKAIECIPTGINLVVLSRRLPLALARPRVHGEIVVLESNELRLTEQETAALAKRRVARRRVKLTASDLRRIHQQTGGWAAGCVADATPPHVGRSGRERGRKSAAIFDYLASAVFLGLTQDAQKVLLYTACLRASRLRR